MISLLTRSTSVHMLCSLNNQVHMQLYLVRLGFHVLRGLLPLGYFRLISPLRLEQVHNPSSSPGRLCRASSWLKFSLSLSSWLHAEQERFISGVC